MARTRIVASGERRSRESKGCSPSLLAIRHWPLATPGQRPPRATGSPPSVPRLILFLILHADHEQNCSTSTVRMVGSSGASLFASVSAGVCALGGESPKSIVEKVKARKFRLMGFGHRVYKNFDHRAK